MNKTVLAAIPKLVGPAEKSPCFRHSYVQLPNSIFDVRFVKSRSQLEAKTNAV
jgi:hypothetical protein